MSENSWQSEPVDDQFAANARGWLAGRMSDGRPWLLAHADDGVIWGKRQKDGSLTLSGEVFNDPDRFPSIAVDLDAETLQQARIFGPEGELLIWRGDDGFYWRSIDDGPEPPDDAIEEWHLLWGMGERIAAQDGFSLLQEGQRGQRHAPPLDIDSVPNADRPALKVRHYIAYDKEDQAYIALSRLVKLAPDRRAR